MKRQYFKKTISLLIAVIMLINIMPNFGLLKNISYAASESKGIVLKSGLSDFETMTDGSKRYILNIYMKDVTSATGVVDFTYNSAKLVPAKYTETDLSSLGMGIIKQLTNTTEFSESAKYFNVIDNPYGDASYIDADNSEIYATFIENNSDPITAEGELLICTIDFKVVDDSLRISDITNDDFQIDLNYSFLNIDDDGDGEGTELSEGYFYTEISAEPQETKVTSISISEKTSKTYVEGEHLDLSNTIVTKTYSDGTSDTEGTSLANILTDTTNYEVKIVNGENTKQLTSETTLAVGDVLKVRYKGADAVENIAEAEFTINVRAKKVTSLEIRGLNSSYKQGTEIDLSTMSVVAIYENDSTDTRMLGSDEYTLTATGNNIVDGKIKLDNAVETTITATYNGTDIADGVTTPLTATHTITVDAKVVTAIQVTPPTTTEYTQGENLNLTGMVVTAIYDDNINDTKTLQESDYTVSLANGSNLNTLGVQTITVTYGDKTDSFDILVFPTKLVGTEGENLSTVVAGEGFEWVSGNDTLAVGENTYILKYTNTSSENQKTCNVTVLGIPTNLTATYGDTLADVTLPAGFSWSNTTTLVGDVGDRQHDITYTGYIGLTATVTVARKTLTKADLTYTMLSGKTYDGQPIDGIDITAPTGAGTVEVKYYKDGETIGSTTAPTNVGTYKVKVSVLEGTNYTALAETELDGSFEITKATLIADDFIKNIPENKVYDGTAITAATAVLKDGMVGVGDTITVKYYKDGETVGSTEAPSDYGTYTVKVNITEGINYFAADGTEGKPEIEIGSFSITKKQLTKDDIDFTAPNPNTYDSSEKPATVAIKSSVVGAGTISAIKYYKNGVETNPIDAGEYIVKITTTGATNYENVTDLEVGTFTIEKADPIYTEPTGLTAIYGDELSTIELPEGFTWEKTGKVGDAGTRTHTVKYTPITEVEKNNYKEKTGIEVEVEVGKADLKAENFELEGMPEGNSKEYDGNPVNVTSKVKAEVPGADDIRNAVTVEYYKDGAKVTDTSDYGTYEVKVSVVEGNNYNAVNGLKIGEFNITGTTLKDADIEYTAPENLEYDGQVKTATVEIPEKAGDVTIIYEDEKGNKITDPKDAGKYTVKITTTGGDNFAAVTEPMKVGEFTIAPKPVTVTIEDKTSIYGEEIVELTSIIPTGAIVGTDNLGITLAKEEGTDAKEYEISGTATNTNYDVTFTNKDGTSNKGKYTITQREITVTIEDKTSVYKEGLETLTSKLVAGTLALGDTVEKVVTLEKEEGTDAGTYDITVSSTNTNYDVTFTNEGNTGTYTITKATLKPSDFDVTGIPEGNSKEHDGREVEVTATLAEGTVGAGNTIIIKYYQVKETGNINLLTPPSDYGTYIVKVNINEGTNYFAANGTEEYPEIEIGSFTISAEKLNDEDISYTNTAVYDGKAKTAEDANITINDDTTAIIANVKYYKDGIEVEAKNVGTYTVKADIESGKYGTILEKEIGTFEITKRPITVTLGTAESVYGEDLSGITANITEGSLAEGDNLTNIIKYSELSDKNVGTHNITGQVKETELAKNYDVTFANEGTYTITQKTITIVIGNTNSVYTGNEPTLPDGLISLKSGFELAYEDKITDLKITLAKDAGEDVGTYAIRGTSTDTNYDITFENGTYEITKATLEESDFSRDIKDVTYGTEITINPAYTNGITTADAGSITEKYYRKEDDGTETLVENPTEVGTYVVKVSTPGGKNYYPADGISTDEEGNIFEQIKLGEFKITKSSEPFILTGVTFDDKTVTYNKEEQEITVTGTIPNGIIVSYEGNKGTDVGEYNATATLTIDKTSALYERYESVKVEGTDGNTLTATLTIEQKNPNDEPEYDDDLNNDELNGGYTKPYKTVLSSITLPTGNKGTFTWKTPTNEVGNVGTQTHKVIYTPADTNYKPVEIDVNIEVTPIDPEYNLGELEATYGETLADVTLPTSENGTFTWNDDATTTSVGNAGKRTFKVTFTPNDTTNYNTLTDIDVTVNVAKAIPPYTKPTGLEGYEGQPLSSIDIEAFTGFSWTNSNEILPLIKDNGETFNTTMTYTPADTANFETVENISVQVKVKENEIKAIRVTSTKEDGTNPEYYEGQTFNRDDILVEAEWAIGGWQTVTDYTIVDETRSLTTSDTEMVINYAGKTANQAITVKPDVITGITITAPNKLEYNYGEAIDLTNATITRIWASGIKHANDKESMKIEMLSIIAPEQLPTFNFSSMNKVGTHTVQVTVDGFKYENARFQITVKDYIDSISIVDKPTLEKTYEYGDNINITGAQISVNYKSGNTELKDITTSMLSGYSMTTLGNQTVIVTYEGKTDTFNINVEDKETGIEITKKPSKRLYKLNETTDFSDIEIANVMASGAKGTTLTASEYTISINGDTTTKGEKTVTVTKNGTTYTDTFTIKVIDATEDMYISKLPKQDYKYGEPLDLTEGKITVKTQTEEKELPMTDKSVKVTGYNPNGLGEQTVTVTYTYEEETENGTETKTIQDTFTVTVEDYETNNIKITPPTKTKYEYGENLDLTGGTVSKIWASGKLTDTVEISGEMISAYNPTKVGTQTIIVNAFGKENVGSFEVTVVDSTLGISMNKLPEKQEYTQGEDIDITGATINVTKSSGTKEIPVTKEMISGYDPNKVGLQVITVTVDGKQTQFPINVKAKTTDKPTTPPNRPTKPTNPTKPITEQTEKYTVTFINYDGEVIKEEIVEKGKSATAPELETRVGYKFLGWDKEFDNVEKDMTITAIYSEIIRAEVETNGTVTVEQGEDLDLEDVTLIIYDENGEKIDEIPVTLDLISGFDSEKVGNQTVTVTYVDEDGYEYTATFKARVTRKQEVLGVKDEVIEGTKDENIILPVVAGASAIGLLGILMALATRKNIEIYALTEEKRKLIGKQKISKNNIRIELDQYEQQLENANIEIVLNKNITKKLNGRTVDIIFKGKKATYKVQENYNKEFSIKIRNA